MTKTTSLGRRSGRGRAGSGFGWAGVGVLDAYCFAGVLGRLGIGVGLWGRVVVGGSRWVCIRIPAVAVVVERAGRIVLVVGGGIGAEGAHCCRNWCMVVGEGIDVAGTEEVVVGRLRVEEDGFLAVHGMCHPCSTRLLPCLLHFLSQKDEVGLEILGS